MWFLVVLKCTKLLLFLLLLLLAVPLQILAGRSEKRQLGSRKGNTFSIAHFAAAGGAEPEQAEAAEAEADAAPRDAKAFWADLLPEAVQAHEAALVAAKEPEVRLGASLGCCWQVTRGMHGAVE
jgi:hypothetical protein